MRSLQTAERSCNRSGVMLPRLLHDLVTRREMCWACIRSADESFFPGAAPIEAHRNESYQTSKGTIRFPASKPLPAALVKKLVKTRIEENESRQKKSVKR